MVEILEDRRLMAASYLTGTESLSVSSKGEIATTSASLKQGAWYCISVSGSVTMGKFANGSSRGVDAEYGQLYGSGDWATKSDRNTYYDWNLAFGQSSPSRVDWGAYNSSHSYSKVIRAGADGQLQFSFLDQCYGDNSGSFSVSVEPIDLRLQDVTFADQGVTRDSGAAYSGAQWHDANRDGTISDSGASAYSNGTLDGSTEHRYPVSYKRSTASSESHLNATVTLPYSGTAGSNWQIKGSASGYTFPAVAVSSSSGTLSASLTAQEALPQTIRDTELDITWQLSMDGGASFFTVGESKNRLYITGGNAAGALETVLDIGCGAADGVNMREDHLASDQRTAVDHIWGKFAGRSVKRVDGTLMTYTHVSGTGMDAADILGNSTGNGQCTAWADLMVQTLRTQGVTASTRDLTAAPSVDVSAFVVKSVPAQGSQGQPYEYMGTTRERAFRFHQIVYVNAYNTRLYDPSYGVMAEQGGGLSALAAYENQCLSEREKSGMWVSQSENSEDLLMGRIDWRTGMLLPA